MVRSSRVQIPCQVQISCQLISRKALLHFDFDDMLHSIHMHNTNMKPLNRTSQNEWLRGQNSSAMVTSASRCRTFAHLLWFFEVRHWYWTRSVGCYQLSRTGADHAQRNCYQRSMNISTSYFCRRISAWFNFIVNSCEAEWCMRWWRPQQRVIGKHNQFRQSESLIFCAVVSL